MTAGIALVITLAACEVLLALRLADQSIQKPRDHLLILAAAVLAAVLAARMFDAAAHLSVIRWSAPAGAAGLLLFLLVDRRAQRRARYAGTERRGVPRVGTDPDQDYPRPE